jgi:hypothetical protein
MLIQVAAIARAGTRSLEAWWQCARWPHPSKALARGKPQTGRLERLQVGMLTIDCQGHILKKEIAKAYGPLIVAARAFEILDPARAASNACRGGPGARPTTGVAPQVYRLARGCVAAGRTGSRHVADPAYSAGRPTRSLL